MLMGAQFLRTLGVAAWEGERDTGNWGLGGGRETRVPGPPTGTYWARGLFPKNERRKPLPFQKGQLVQLILSEMKKKLRRKNG